MYSMVYVAICLLNLLLCEDTLPGHLAFMSASVGISHIKTTFNIFSGYDETLSWIIHDSLCFDF